MKWPTDLGFGDDILIIARDVVTVATPEKLETDDYEFAEDDDTLIAVIKL